MFYRPPRHPSFRASRVTPRLRRAPGIVLDGVTVTRMILRGSNTTANEIVVTLMDLEFDMFTLEATKYVTAQVACPSALWTNA